MTLTTGPDGKPVAFADFPRDAFPITITAYAPDDSIVWEEVLEDGPGILEIPGTGPGSVKRVVVRYADGTESASDENDS